MKVVLVGETVEDSANRVDVRIGEAMEVVLGRV